MRIVACVDGHVGGKLTAWLIENFPEAISLFVTVSENELFDYCTKKKVPVVSAEGQDIAAVIDEDFELGLLLWWPALISKEAIQKASTGYINTHPSLLPLHRGRNPNFWALRNGEPFGVSLHFIGKGIDDGDLVAQAQVPYDWTDTGGSIYQRGQNAMVDLFKLTFPRLLDGSYDRNPIKIEEGSLHFGKELGPASIIELDAAYRARDLLNLIRAKTFGSHPACRFEDIDGWYEVRVAITKIDS